MACKICHQTDFVAEDSPSVLVSPSEELQMTSKAKQGHAIQFKYNIPWATVCKEYFVRMVNAKKAYGRGNIGRYSCRHINAMTKAAVVEQQETCYTGDPNWGCFASSSVEVLDNFLTSCLGKEFHQQQCSAIYLCTPQFKSATVGWGMWWFILAFSCPCMKGSEACIHKKLAKAHLKNKRPWFTGKDGESDKTETINDTTSSAEETTNGNPQYCSTMSSTEIPENVHMQLAYQMGECCGC